jgi:hypothetical protein
VPIFGDAGGVDIGAQRVGERVVARHRMLTGWPMLRRRITLPMMPNTGKWSQRFRKS